MSCDRHLVVHVARALPGEDVADQPLPLSLSDQRLDHLAVLLGVEPVRVGRRQIQALGLDRHLVRQVLVGHEQDVGHAQPLGDARRVRAGAAGVRQRLHVGVRVDVRHRREAPPDRSQEILPLGDVIGVDLGERAERVQVRQVDGSLRRQRVAPLCHEAHTAEDHAIGVDVARAHRQLERITDDVGDRLHLGHLVVVRRNERALVALQPPDLVPQKFDASGVLDAHLSTLHQAIERHVDVTDRHDSGLPRPALGVMARDRVASGSCACSTPKSGAR